MQVNCVHPSLVETERQWRRIRAEIERSGEPEAKVREELCRETGITRFGKVEDVADLVTFMVSSRASWLHGATIDLDGGEIRCCDAALAERVTPKRLLHGAAGVRTA